ncbi:UNVERIFIED_CONTAM: cytochrome [Sesamum latifolium]|uniref:Cytochrome n=1 Tax=Sesamum latifolium TaxID=2727402 RepID=A0AAW2XAG2_9LAMI
METTWLLYAFLSLFVLALVFKFSSKGKRKLPPSPGPALPLLGHLHHLKLPLHQTYYNLSKKLGPIFSLRLGNRIMVVVTSPALVEECFIKNDIVLANRPLNHIGKYIGYNYTSLVASPYGDHWRNLRRLTTLEVFATTRLNMFQSIRHDEVRLMLKRLYRNSYQDFARVELRSRFMELTFNNIMRMVDGKRYIGEDVENEEAKEFRQLIEEVGKLIGASNPVDFFPVFRWTDYKKYEKNWAEVSARMDSFMQGDANWRNKYISDDSGMGNDLSAQPPQKLDKARAEIDNLVGINRLVNESDLSNLPYLQNIISETFRLFPALQLLIPHEASADCKLGGYDIPRGTVVQVNAWAVHRDPTVWDDPTSFNPERFQEVGEVGPTKLLPFGTGRRSCPGYGLANRVVGLTLASLIQCFEWQRIDDALVELTEGKGISRPNLPLEAMCKGRHVFHKALTQSA